MFLKPHRMTKNIKNNCNNYELRHTDNKLHFTTSTWIKQHPSKLRTPLKCNRMICFPSSITANKF